jgi:hypothetical protein
LSTTNLDALLKFHQDDTGVCDAIRKAMGYQAIEQLTSLSFPPPTLLYCSSVHERLWRDTVWVTLDESVGRHNYNLESAE